MLTENSKRNLDIITSAGKSDSYADDDTRQIKPYRGASRRSQARLQYLGFDPLEEMVKQYKEIQSEIERQKQIRAGAIVELKANGEEKTFWSQDLYMLYDKQINIADKLLKYAYTTPTEDDGANKAVPKLTVIMSQEGEVYSVGDGEDDEGEDPPDADDSSLNSY